MERAVKEVQQGKTMREVRKEMWKGDARSSGKEKGGLKGSKPTKAKKKVLSSSSEESDIPIPLSDGTDYESPGVQSDEDGGVCQ